MKGQNPQISIIVPIYNVEEYLEECLKSIIGQTFGVEKLQVIMVNDGSTDGSKEIIDEYEKKYANFIAYHFDKPHGVAGTARNKGIELSNGEYIMFIDPDDFYDLKACEVMYNYAKENDADMVTCNYQNTNEVGEKWDKPIFDTEKYKSFKLFEKDQYEKDSFYVYCSSVCVKIFRHSFLEENSIKFLEGVPAEDAYVTLSTLLKSKQKIYYLDDVIYYYRQRNMSKKTKSVSWNRSKWYFDRVNRAYKAIYKLFEDAGKLDIYKYTYSKNLNYMIYKFIDSTQISDSQRIQIMKDMRWFYEKTRVLEVKPVQEAIEILIDKIIKENYESALDMCKIIHEYRTYIPDDVKESMSKPRQIFI